jgi:hypothetical protein
MTLMMVGNQKRSQTGRRPQTLSSSSVLSEPKSMWRRYEEKQTRGVRGMTMTLTNSNRFNEMRNAGWEANKCAPGMTSPPPQSLKLSGEYEAEFCSVHASVSKEERKEG